MAVILIVGIAGAVLLLGVVGVLIFIKAAFRSDLLSTETAEAAPSGTAGAQLAVDGVSTILERPANDSAGPRRRLVLKRSLWLIQILVMVSVIDWITTRLIM